MNSDYQDEAARQAEQARQEQAERGTKDRDLAARILALETLTGNEDSKDHHVFVTDQSSYRERIANAHSPDMREELQAGKFAHAQSYAADLCEQGHIQLGLEGRFEAAASLMQEAHIRREIAEGISPGGPENTSPESGDALSKNNGNIADSMREAAVEALGPKTDKGDYAALREETPTLEQSDGRATVADYGFNIRPVMEVAPEGTYIASRPQSNYEARETDYEDGPSRPGTVAYVSHEAARVRGDDKEGEETRIAEASQKSKREIESGTKGAELHTAISEAAREVTARPLSRAERAELAAAEHAAEAEHERESTRAMSGQAGGRGGR